MLNSFILKGLFNVRSLAKVGKDVDRTEFEKTRGIMARPSTPFYKSGDVIWRVVRRNKTHDLTLMRHFAQHNDDGLWVKTTEHVFMPLPYDFDRRVWRPIAKKDVQDTLFYGRRILERQNAHATTTTTTKEQHNDDDV